ncbi:stabilizer of axonemal microtubules 2-like isoform X2 [Coregonus clupeaformis]|uniref:stabilizer of axonemal microtubules 2-like isoform X2 n=1 Tax=Coregonus clupeaformis TaxID=59861 RepID=UPI001BDF8647|nr:stabilizer of axonemal microtubules 2-like isoform X2 [Coregonus clupeaformis]
MTIQCLCQICTCGHHHCSQGSHPEEPCVLIPGCMVSEYQEKYPAYCTTVVRAAKKLNNEYQPLEGRISNMTTFKSDYVAHEVTQRPPKVTKVYEPPDGRMRHSSTYTRDYPTHPVQKHIVTKPEVYHPPTAKMVAQSLYKVLSLLFPGEFRAWHNQKVQPYRTCDNLKLNDSKFEVTTTFQDDYCYKGPTEARESFKPAADTRETLPFDGATNYHTQYVPHPVQPTQPKGKAVYRPTSAPLNGVSTYRQDYRGLPAEPAKPFRAKVAWESSPAVFQGTSEFRDQYKVWPLQPKHQHQAEKYCPPEGTMVGLSTAHADYVDHECQQRPQSARPPVEAWVKEAREPLQTRSTMKEDYRTWDVVPPPPMVYADELEKPKGAFANTTTFRSAYTPKTAQRATSFKPTQKLLSPKAMDEESIYRSTYTPKEIPPCPARDGCPPGFEYSSMGAGGHRLYRTTSVQETGLAAATSDKPSYSHSRKSCRVPSRAKRAP